MRATGMMGQSYLIAIDHATGLLAGGVAYDPGSGEIGGWLAPRFRGRRLGAELFTSAMQFAHYHLGKEYVLAGTEPANVSCVRALLAAGFIPASGPDAHRLPDGRIVPSRWFQHVVDQPVECG